MRKKEMAAAILGRRTASLFRLKSSTLTLPILAYHRVLDDDPAAFPFDEQLISAGQPAFREQMQFVRDNFEAMSFEDLHRHEFEGRPWPRRALIITFDDGYADNYANAFPILKELGLKATIFLTTGHIGENRMFWWDRIAYLIKHTKADSMMVPDGGDRIALNGAPSRKEAIDRILGWIKKAPERSKNEFVEALPEILATR